EKSPAAFFARKILTPQLTGDLIDALIPHFQEILGTSATSAAAATAQTGGSFSGDMHDWPVVTVIAFFESSARKGALTLRHDGKEITTYLQGGEIVGVTTHDAAEYMRGLRWSTRKNLPPEIMKTAAVEQQQSGTPVIVTLAATGHFPATELTQTLAARGRRLLVEMLGATAVKFEWHDLDVLPSYVEAHGRHISTARNTLIFGNDSEGQEADEADRALEELRQSPPRPGLDGSSVFARCRGFSQQVSKFSLTAQERQVLAFVDGQLSAEQLAVSVELETAECLAILSRLTEVRLLSLLSANQAQPADYGKPRPLMIFEADRAGFQIPLAAMLESRREPIALLDLSVESDLLAAIRRERPQKVLLNANVLPLADTLRNIRSDPELVDVAVIAILEPEAAQQAAELDAMGFDEVLVKPIARADIERLLSS
ncbi:MAG TPA: DUF4388 domain-containing protein, partial [Polyangiaceae bacterium]